MIMLFIPLNKTAPPDVFTQTGKGDFGKKYDSAYEQLLYGSATSLGLKNEVVNSGLHTEGVDEVVFFTGGHLPVENNTELPAQHISNTQRAALDLAKRNRYASNPVGWIRVSGLESYQLRRWTVHSKRTDDIKFPVAEGSGHGSNLNFA
jgi:hypothetical protein